MPLSPPIFAPREDRGFTLIEMMAVLAIVGVLFGLAFSLAGYATRSARKAKAASQLERLGNAVHGFFTENGVLPVALTEITNRLAPGFVFEPDTGSPVDPWLNAYVYQTNSPYSFVLFSYGPDGSGSPPDKHILLGR